MSAAIANDFKVHPREEAVMPSRPVGFDSITSQIEKRLLKRGFQFNLMVVGQSGLGKSTLINTLFASSAAKQFGRKLATDPIERTPEIKSDFIYLYENEVNLKLTVIDTPGYGDQVNNEKCWEPIVKHIKEQQSLYLRRELTASRDRFLEDARIHCVLFFIQPTGHSLKPLDLIVLKRLTEIANVVPVIAKSDSLTLQERAAFKQAIRAELAYHKFNIYPYERSTEDGLYDANDLEADQAIRNLIPFAVVGSDRTEVINGREVRVRKNRWGTVNVEDETHCEFLALRRFLMSTHLQDLIETTAHIHYEEFRKKQLTALKENSSKEQQSTVGGTALSGPVRPSAVPAPPAKK